MHRLVYRPVYRCGCRQVFRHVHVGSSNSNNASKLLAIVKVMVTVMVARTEPITDTGAVAVTMKIMVIVTRQS